MSLALCKQAHSGAVVAMDVAPDMKWLVSGGEDCRIMLWNVNLQTKDDTDDTISKVLQVHICCIY